MKKFMRLVQFTETEAEKEQLYKDMRIWCSFLTEEDAERWLNVLPEHRRELLAFEVNVDDVTVKKHSGPELDKIMANQFPDFAYAKKPIKTVIQKVTHADKAFRKSMKKAMKKARR